MVVNGLVPLNKVVEVNVGEVEVPKLDVLCSVEELELEAISVGNTAKLLLGCHVLEEALVTYTVFACGFQVGGGFRVLTDGTGIGSRGTFLAVHWTGRRVAGLGYWLMNESCLTGIALGYCTRAGCACGIALVTNPGACVVNITCWAGCYT